MDLSEVSIRTVAEGEEPRFRSLLQEHHYLGPLPAMGETVRYVVHRHERWLALAIFSAPALKCGPRDGWIGWDRGVRFHRLHLVSNNSRFLILPGGPRNLGSRALALCARRLVRDWPARFGHELLLLETYVDPARFHGTVYRAANWIEAGLTRGFGRAGTGYREHAEPKRVFLLPLCRDARVRLRNAHLEPGLQKGVPKVTLSKEQMTSMPEFFRDVDDPRRAAGRRHTLPSVLSLALAATLSGARGYKAISEWVNDLSPKVLAHFGVRFRNRTRIPPSRTVIRDVLVRVDPRQLDDALRAWTAANGGTDSALAGRVVTVDALLTQRALANYLLEHGAAFLFTVKGNQKTLMDDIRLLMDEAMAERPPDFVQESRKPEHGRLERRSIWASAEINDYVRFPGVGQVFAVRREVTVARTGERRVETACGVTSLSPEAASPKRLLELNRGHWRIEATHHVLDWSFDEDRSRIRTGHGPANTTLFRRFAIGLIRQRGLEVAETMRAMARKPRRVLDMLRMTGNTRPRTAAA